MSYDVTIYVDFACSLVADLSVKMEAMAGACLDGIGWLRLILVSNGDARALYWAELCLVT